MLDAYAEILASGLSIWEHKEANKYRDKVAALRKERFDELNKERPDHNILDINRYELLFVGKAFNSKIADENA